MIGKSGIGILLFFIFWKVVHKREDVDTLSGMGILNFLM